MARYEGWVIHTNYHKVEVEADSCEEAEELMFDINLDNLEPVRGYIEVYDIEEVTQNG